jgi:xanthine dehydrogenase YagR molybdenum-binding subunit
MADMQSTTQPAPPGKKYITVPQVVNGVPGEVQILVDDTTGPAWGANDKHRLLNSRLERADGPAKTTGTAIYTYDVRLPGMLYGRFLTSPYAHAKILKIDTKAAAKIPGVMAVEKVEGEGAEVRYEGQPVVVVAAKTPEAAADAIRALDVQYQKLPHVVIAEDALQPDAPRIFKEDGPQKAGGDLEKVIAALATCDAVVEATYRTVIMHHCCLETHGVVVDYRGGDSATVYATTQGTFTIPGDAARTLGLDRSHVTAIVHHMGGGFGSKFGLGFAGQWGCRLSKELGVPVKMMLTRRDEFLGAGNGPGSIQKIKAGVTKDGTLVALQAEQYGLGGVGRGGIGEQPYQYQAQHAYHTQQAVHTNEDSSCAMRAPGHPQASFAIESLMDELAYKIGMDPVEFRKKNLPSAPKRAHDAQAWTRQLDRGAQEIGWQNRNPTPGKLPGPLVRGMGCGIGAWGGGGGPQCVVNITIGQDGSVVAAVGSQDLGTGTRTYIKAIVAEELGLKLADVTEKIGDSNLGAANSSGGSTTAASLSPAVKDAAYNARLAMAKKVAPVIGIPAEAVIFDGGTVGAQGGTKEKTLTWKQACAALPPAGLTARGEWKPGLSGSGAHGVSFAEVEVDLETGHVRPIKMVHVQDGGLPLNRAAMESQINGGMIQSMGMALFEGRVMDRDLGVMLNPGFGDYKLPGAMEIPELVPIIDDGDTRQVVIGIAEPANIPGVGAVANAVFNACGVRVRELPITPDKILDGLAHKLIGRATT